MGKYAELYFMYEVWRTRILMAAIVLWIVLGIAIAIGDFVAKRRK